MNIVLKLVCRNDLWKCTLTYKSNVMFIFTPLEE